ncbi:hypothetical protein F0919_10995 [Taibaiella lutea]|uniref:Uncharacterized protein n=1 Tax=Taibaiella lutea TaxID=2608001 RepID=A0A5M6CKZ9_9BACT|nr:hypothetical protein [Taibaiella lutea]KAA5535110.1 hypothetical protein F0919_10995 [Taibaiella lutea]
MGIHNHIDHINNVINQDIADCAFVNTVQELESKVNVNDQTAYIQADAFTDNPYQLLGQIVEIRKVNDKCPSRVNVQNIQFEFCVDTISGFKIDVESKMSKPVLRSSIIADKELCVKAGFLNFLGAQLDDKSSFSLIVIDQAKGLVDFQHSSWQSAVTAWKAQNQEKINDPDICYIYAITGFVQKNIIRKRYSRFEASGRGGAYGINLQGKLFTSTEDYSLDIVFGLTPAIIKRPAREIEAKAMREDYIPDAEELAFFALGSGSQIQKRIERTV